MTGPASTNSDSASHPPESPTNPLPSTTSLPDNHPHLLPPLPPATYLEAPAPLSLPPGQQVSSSPRSRATTLFFIITLLSLISAIFFGYQYYSLKHQLTNLTKPPNELVPTPTQLTQYSNPDFEFSLSLPSDLQVITDPSSDSNHLVLYFASSQSAELVLEVTPPSTPSEINTWHDTPSRGQRIIAGHLWQTFYRPSYQESSLQQPPVGFALKLLKNNFVYTFYLPLQSDTTPLTDQIIASLTFHSQ